MLSYSQSKLSLLSLESFPNFQVGSVVLECNQLGASAESTQRTLRGRFGSVVSVALLSSTA